MDVARVRDGEPLHEDQRNDARNVMEAIGNLLYLIQLDAEDSNLVRSYTSQAEERLAVLARIVHESSQRLIGRAQKIVPISTSNIPG